MPSKTNRKSKPFHEELNVQNIQNLIFSLTSRQITWNLGSAETCMTLPTHSSVKMDSCLRWTIV